MDINFFQELKKEGGQGFYVGGFVRDKLMGYESKDFDIEVFGIEENKLQTILEKYGSVKIVGNFEIYLLEKNVEVYLSKEKKLETSAKRRDLTINAMYYDPLDDKIYDFFNGQKDIEEKILRYCNKETFIIDSLRIMRVAYFGAKYAFKIDEELMVFIKENKEKILLVDSDRVFQQFEKILFLEENQQELSNTLENTTVDENDINTETTEEIIKSLISQIETENIDKNVLINIYEGKIWKLNFLTLK